MAFRNRGNRASIIFSHFSLFCLGRVLYSLFLSLLFLKRSIFRLVIEGWQEGEGVSESASGVKLQSFLEKMRPRKPRNSHALWCISKAETNLGYWPCFWTEWEVDSLCAIGRSLLRNDEMPYLSSLGHKCMWEQKGGVCFKEKNECPNMLQQKRFLKPCLRKKVAYKGRQRSLSSGLCLGQRAPFSNMEQLVWGFVLVELRWSRSFISGSISRTKSRDLIS